MPKTNLRHQVVIDALTSKLWKVLTEPEYVQQWMNASFEGEWKPGEQILFSAGEEKTVAIVNDLVPGMLLSYSFLHPSANENLCFEIIPDPCGLELKFVSSGFSDTDEQYFLRVQNAHLQLQKIKWLAQFG